MATAEDDGIEILSCHIEPEEEACTETTSTTTATSVRYCNGKTVGLLTERSSDNSDPVSKHRKRIARVVAIVTFVLLLFSVVLIGVSLNMSKNIDEMVRNNDQKPQPDPKGDDDTITKESNVSYFSHRPL